jgi:plasmid stability protein
VAQRQANIRLDDGVFERLEAAAFIHRRSIADELRSAVEEWVEKHQNDPRVRAARELRDPSDEPEDTIVSSLDEKRSRKSDA